MPQERNTRSKIPVAGHNPHFHPSKKSGLENLKPEVKNKQKPRVKNLKPVPAAPDGEKRRHLSVVDTNTREGSKSSVSDVEGDVFHTAPKEVKVNKRPKGGRIHTKSSKEKQETKTRSGRIGEQGETFENPIENTTTTSTSVVNLNFFPEHDIQEPLPDGVVNIEVDDGLYEYSREVVVYLKVLEAVDPIPDGFLDEGSVTANMRSILVDWIIQVQHHLKLCQETLYLGIGILDMVLHRRDVDPDKLQLVGVTALLVASKLEEYYPVDIKKLLHLTENSYSRVEVTHMERTVLDVLEFQVYLPSPQVFLLRFSRAAFRSDDPEFLKTCQYLLDTHLPLPSHPSLPPSLLAASAVACSSLLYYVSANASIPKVSTIWTPTLVYYTKYNLAMLLTTCQEMMDQVLAATTSTTKFTGALVKYKSMSQHQRLVLAKHLTVDVLKRTSLVLTDWNDIQQLQ